jgi:hypothetical protein
MANSQTGNFIYCDTAGILSKAPLCIEWIQYVPHAVTDVLDLNFWDEANPVSGSSRNVASCTITGTNTLTDADTGGVLTAARYPATDILKLYTVGEGGGNGSALNHTYHLIETAGDNNAIVTGTTLTNETTMRQKMICYPSAPFFNVTCSSVTNAFETKFHYLGGVLVPNLIAETITSGASAIICFR